MLALLSVVVAATFAFLITGTREQRRDQAFGQEVASTQTALARFTHDLRSATRSSRPPERDRVPAPRRERRQLRHQVRLLRGRLARRELPALRPAPIGLPGGAAGRARERRLARHPARGERVDRRLLQRRWHAIVRLGLLLRRPPAPRRRPRRRRPATRATRTRLPASPRRTSSHDEVPASGDLQTAAYVTRRPSRPRSTYATRTRGLDAPPRGLSLIELLVAITVLLVGTVAAISAFDAGRGLSSVAERQTSIAHRAQLELERVALAPLQPGGLTRARGVRGRVGSRLLRDVPAGSARAPRRRSPTYQPDHAPGGSTATEPLSSTAAPTAPRPSPAGPSPRRRRGATRRRAATSTTTSPTRGTRTVRGARSARPTGTTSG